VPVYRTLFHSDLELLEAHYRRLTPRDRSLRFFACVSDAYLDNHCEKIDWQHSCLIGCFIDHELRGVSELHFDKRIGSEHGEVSFSVEDPWQHDGIGTELLRRILMVARNRLVHSLSVVCLMENRGMRKLVRKFSDDMHVSEGEVNAEIAVPLPSLFSLFDEACLNSLGWMAALDRKLHPDHEHGHGHAKAGLSDPAKQLERSKG
jgi:GNAT superfamily N-acetyltransferase